MDCEDCREDRLWVMCPICKNYVRFSYMEKIRLPTNNDVLTSCYECVEIFLELYKGKHFKDKNNDEIVDMLIKYKESEV